MPSSALPPLVVFSHLRWGFVFQRPQHLMTRLADRWSVLFVEEPVHTTGAPRLEIVRPRPGIEVLVPHSPVAAPGFHDDQLPVLKALLRAEFAQRGIARPVTWLYTPLALPLVDDLAPRLLVYDCMDDLASFRLAPPQLREREAALMKRASLVFTGGPSLYEARVGRHPSVHCLPSSVDVAHFAPGHRVPGSGEDAAAAALQPAGPGPRLGYYGVIDERMDLALVDELARRRPDWQIVMVGPVVKIDPAALPSRPNLHWRGMQPYERLPYLLAGWDLCLLPFALNEATRFISPTKTLEYLAGEKPVVSTGVQDVVTLYGHVVAVADGAEAFIAACERLLAESPEQRLQRLRETLSTVSRQSWAHTADTIQRLIDTALAPAEPPPPAEPEPAVADLDRA